MARSYGRVAVGRWRDPSWRVLSRDAQWCYLALSSQAKLNLAGVLDVKLGSWTDWASDSEEVSILAALDELSTADWILVDWEHHELALRTHVADDDALKNSNLGKGMWSAFDTVESERIRAFLVDNLPGEAWEERFNPPFHSREIHRSNLGSDSGSNPLILHPATSTGTRSRPPSGARR